MHDKGKGKYFRFSLLYLKVLETKVLNRSGIKCNSTTFRIFFYSFVRCVFLYTSDVKSLRG